MHVRHKVRWLRIDLFSDEIIIRERERGWNVIPMERVASVIDFQAGESKGIILVTT